MRNKYVVKIDDSCTCNLASSPLFLNIVMQYKNEKVFKCKELKKDPLSSYQKFFGIQRRSKQ